MMEENAYLVCVALIDVLPQRAELFVRSRLAVLQNPKVMMLNAGQWTKIVTYMEMIVSSHNLAAYIAG